ncbi:hypothetical protein GCM10009795_011520 [Nocardioides hankookensis]|uniref:PRC-barrel domain-containing protein n=1 Tax=Nocardioides hankookensis TaxID=443157 RepID=A0ABW1LH71_9ACTN
MPADSLRGTDTDGRATTPAAELVYLSASDLRLSSSEDDLRGLVLLGRDGLRIGEIADLVIDVAERRPRLLSVASGGLLGLAEGESLVPVEAVARTGDRVRLTWSHACAHGHPLRHLTSPAARAPGRASGHANVPFAAAYAAFGVRPFWETPHR